MPCIESAWGSVCKSECQKAVAESLDVYKQRLEQAVAQGETLDDALNHRLLAEIEQHFRQLAVGEELENFLERMAKESSVIFQQIQQRQLNQMKKQFTATIQPVLVKFDRKLQELSSAEDIGSYLSQLKEELELATVEIHLPSKGLLILQTLFDQQKKAYLSII